MVTDTQKQKLEVCSKYHAELGTGIGDCPSSCCVESASIRRSILAEMMHDSDYGEGHGEG